MNETETPPVPDEPRRPAVSTEHPTSDARRGRRTRLYGLTAIAAVLAAGTAAALLWGESDSRPSTGIAIDPNHPLQAEVRLRARGAQIVSVDVRSDDGQGFRVTPPEDEAARSVLLLGLRAETTYDVTAEAIDAGGQSFTLDERITTGALPPGFPPVQVATAPGDTDLTLFDATHTPPEEADVARDLGYLIVVDGDGEVVWYAAQEHPVEDARQTERGTYLFVNDEVSVREISPTGELLREWAGTTALDVATKDQYGRSMTSDRVIRVDTDQMHHEVVEAPNGNLITLSREVRTVEVADQMCDDDSFDGSYAFTADVVVEFEPDTGQIVREFSLFDVLDPLDDVDRLVAEEFCSPYLAPRYPDGGPGGAPARDWTHANAVVLDADRNALIVSARHTDAIYALRYEDDADGPAGELLWTLGEEGTFDLEPGGEWFYHQHAPEISPDGTILLYDNGNRRPGTNLDEPAAYPYSRAVRYAIDEAAGTATQIWEHRFDAEDGMYAPYVGDADRNTDGTTLITHGGLTDPLAHSPGDPTLLLWARLIEVDEATGEVLFDLSIRDPGAEDDWRIYRADRIPSLYPPGWTVEQST